MTPDPATDDVAWREDVDAERKWREAHYAEEDSPLSDEARERFEGLAWYPINARYRVADVKLQRHVQPKPAPLAATGEEGVQMLEVGEFRFKLLGKDCRLTAYEPAEGETDEPYVFVPFKDATSGRETYGGGRYLDFEPREDDSYTLDFNRAYHPYCAHDEEWSCILPPPSNALPVPVEAGERLTES